MHIVIGSGTIYSYVTLTTPSVSPAVLCIAPNPPVVDEDVFITELMRTSKVPVPVYAASTAAAVLEVESQFEGTLLKIIIPAGKEMPVMSIAAVIGAPGEDIPEIVQPVQAAPEVTKPVAPPA